jgi:micrococcal nuclease
MYEYKCKITRVIDGDTVDVDIDLGFDIWLKGERVRIMGIDTPESRTRDDVEKLFGLAAKKRLEELLGETGILKTVIDRNGGDAKEKFGRILGDFVVGDRTVTEILIEEGHAVKYYGQNKADVEVAHLANRNRLMSEGVVDPSEVQAAQKETK